MNNKQLSRNDNIPEMFLILKFGEKSHIEDLYYNGHLYFNTFDYFKNLEVKPDGRADKREYIEEYYSGNSLDNITIEIDGYKLSREGGLLSAEFDTQGIKKYTHLYCVSYLKPKEMIAKNITIDERNFAENKDYVLVIHNVREFQERFRKKAEETGINFRGKCVEYYDPDNYGGEVGCFRKTNDYAYQNEWRIVANFGYDKHTEPQSVYIGSLEDIAFPPMDKKTFYEKKIAIGDSIITNDDILITIKENKNE